VRVNFKHTASAAATFIDRNNDKIDDASRGLSLPHTLSNITAFAGRQKDVILGSAMGNGKRRYMAFSAG